MLVDYIEQAHSLMQSNKINEAIEVLRKAEALSPKNINIKKRLAIAEEKKGDYDKAINVYYQLVKDFPVELAYVLRIADRWYQNDKIEKTEQLLTRMKEIIPDNKEVNDFLSKIEKARKEKENEMMAQQLELKRKKLGEASKTNKIESSNEKETSKPITDIDRGKGLFGYINIRCYPSAEIFIDKRSIGKCPVINYKLPIGKHSVMLKGPGNQIYEKNIFIFSNKLEEIYYSFESYGKIFIQCGDKNYKVYIDNGYVGLTPYYSDKIKSGKHTIIIERIDGQRETKYIFVKPNTMETVQCTFH